MIPHHGHYMKRSVISETTFLSGAFDPSGLIATERLSNMLHITRGELAATLGLSRDAVSKSARLGRPATQPKLRDMVDVLNRVRPWAGSAQQAFAWYQSHPLPSFSDQTAEALVREGRADAVRRYLDRIQPAVTCEVYRTGIPGSQSPLVFHPPVRRRCGASRRAIQSSRHTCFLYITSDKKRPA